MSRAHRFSRETCQQLQLAVELIELGLRRTLVQEMTRLPRNALRPLYQDLHRPVPGGLRISHDAGR